MRLLRGAKEISHKKGTKTGKTGKTHVEMQSQHAGSNGNRSHKRLQDVAIAEPAKNAPSFSCSPLQAHSL